MKVAFLSDIHGNAVALEAVLADIETQHVDQLYVLGDLCFRGPEPKRALDIVRTLQVPIIKGNADEWIVRGVKQGEVPDPAFDIMTQEREWARAQLTQEDTEFLKKLPGDIKASLDHALHVHAFHATPHSLFKNVLPNASEQEILQTLCTEEADLYVYGHIHKAYIKYIEGKCILNLGSVGLPFDGPRASYAIVEVKDRRLHATIEKVPYDIEKVIQLYQNSDYPNKEMMMEVIRTGKL
ncbi:metallophosphoesterase family protein [Pullulanibacillus pueri]|uniref:Serine/threonine protein phosphatase n=1 Tax=Pullulanibacillus pueri TaxID=1437324 RepID=A0A8J2ZUE0_9BACL|nr:metallophosphoesterase family protein [Pullulanibacillus pueri]GGH77467.1 serine/threonine protein phosphatase [Pullulanibacillus pueri]